MRRPSSVIVELSDPAGPVLAIAPSRARTSSAARAETSGGASNQRSAPRPPNLAPRRRSYRDVLLFDREVAVQRKHREVERSRGILEVLGTPLDLAGPWQEHEHVAVEAFLRDPAYRRRDLFAE